MTVIRKAKPRIPETTVDDRLLLWAKILAVVSDQLPGANDVAPVGIAGIDQQVRLRSAYFVALDDIGAGESITIDVTINGLSILAAPVVFGPTTVKGTQIPLTLSAAFLALGQAINTPGRVFMQRTMGGGCITSNRVVLELEPLT